MRLFTVKKDASSGRLLRPVFLAFCLAASGWLLGQEDVFPPKPEPAVFVHDYAGWLTPAEKMTLERKLAAYSDSTSTQIVLMIRRDIGDYDKASYAFELGDRWGIGRKSKNNGVVMLVKTEPPDRGIFIATGYGVEGAVPDVIASRIIREVMAPQFRQQQYYKGINAGLDAIIMALGSEFTSDASDEPQGEFPLWLFFLIFFGILFLIMFIAWKRRHATTYENTGTSRRKPIFRNDPWGHGGGWIGGGGGGGWSSGGGGGFGGGSFGGGGFGGGGAGGDW